LNASIEQAKRNALNFIKWKNSLDAGRKLNLIHIEFLPIESLFEWIIHSDTKTEEDRRAEIAKETHAAEQGEELQEEGKGKEKVKRKGKKDKEKEEEKGIEDRELEGKKAKKSRADQLIIARTGLYPRLVVLYPQRENQPHCRKAVTWTGHKWFLHDAFHYSKNRAQPDYRCLFFEYKMGSHSSTALMHLASGAFMAADNGFLGVHTKRQHPTVKLYKKIISEDIYYLSLPTMPRPKNEDHEGADDEVPEKYLIHRRNTIELTTDNDMKQKYGQWCILTIQS